MPRAHIEVERGGQGFGRVQQERSSLRDLPGEVVRQTAVRERDELIPLQHHDLRVLGQPTSARGEAHAPRNPTDHDNLRCHVLTTSLVSVPHR